MSGVSDTCELERYTCLRGTSVSTVSGVSGVSGVSHTCESSRLKGTRVTFVSGSLESK